MRGRRHHSTAAAALAATAFQLAAGPSAAAAPRPLLLPSPLTPLDTKVPLRTDAPLAQMQLPLNARLDSRERVLVRTLPDGRVVSIRVVQRLTLTGTGDYFLSVPAPLLDARAGPGSQAEPGFRRSGILWQGFVNRRRVLAADATLDPGRAAAALPLRLELRATVDGRPLEAHERRSGRLRVELRLRNTTAVSVPAASARALRPGDVRKLIARVAAEVRRGKIPEQPTLDVEGPVRSRRLVADAPLVVAGVLRLPVGRLGAASVRGGSLVRRAGEAVVRFRLVLAGPSRSSTTIALAGTVTGAAAPRVAVTAEPSAAVALLGAERARSTADASLVLLRLALVRQYDAFLANPAPGGSVEAAYRYETSDSPVPAAASTPASDEGGVVLPVLVAVALLAGAGGLVVLWAHL